jgi:hypothetical protein
MLQITTDISSLTQRQREMLAGFIVTYGNVGLEVAEEKPTLAAAVAEPNPADVFELAESGPSLVIGAAPPSVDSTGLIWDERIHSKSQTLNTDGTWRGRRGITDEQRSAVERELRAVAGPQLVAAPAPPPPPATDLKGEYVALVGRVLAPATAAGKITQDEINAVCVKHGVEGIPQLALKVEFTPAIAAEINAIIASRG